MQVAKHQIRNLPEPETADRDVNITDVSQGSPGFFVRDIRLTQEMFLKQSLGTGCAGTVLFLGFCLWLQPNTIKGKEVVR